MSKRVGMIPPPVVLQDAQPVIDGDLAEVMVNNPKLLDVMPLMIGAAVMGAGAYYDDIWGMVGGVAILSANWYGVIRRRRRSY